MKAADFKTYLTAASYHATKLAERYVEDDLRFEFRFLIHLNQSFDGHATEENELYADDDGRVVECSDFSSVVEILCRKEKVPEWIDISVSGVGDRFTQLELICCGRYTGDPKRLRYASRGQGPFGIKSPILPPGFRQETGERFTLPKVDPDAGINSVTSLRDSTP